MSRPSPYRWALNQARTVVSDLLVHKIKPHEVAICTIHGNSPTYTGDFAVRYSWPQLQIEQLRQHTPPGYTVFALGNRLIPEHEAFLRQCPEVVFFPSRDIAHSETEHVWPLRNWLTRKVILSHRYIFHLDSDAFPVRDDWLARYCGAVSWRCPAVAVQRRENGDVHSDRSFLLFSRRGFRTHGFDFSVVGAVDAGGTISATLEARGLTWWALQRSNAYNFHPLISGIYDDRIYHHAAGSRQPRFRQNQQIWSTADDFAREKAVHRVLMKKLFENPAGFLSQLRGTAPPFDMDSAVANEGPVT